MATTDRSDVRDMEAQAEQFRETFALLKNEMAKKIVGYGDAIDRILIALLCNGHVLLEGVPGLGKTIMVKTLARALHTDFSRIQFTPDLMPADILGTTVALEDEAGGRTFKFQPGPLFSLVVLADEINRATPKTQAALLEAMQETAITVGGKTYLLEEPFIVLGTQNPIEMEGTYPLPEAQLDRFFFKLHLDFLDEDSLTAIVDRTTADAQVQVQPVAGAVEIHRMRAQVRNVAVAEHVKRYAVRIVVASHPDKDAAPEAVRRYVRYGASPRGIQALILAGKARALTEGRLHVSCADIRHVAPPALRHRILRNFEGEAGEISTDTILEEILQATPEMDGKK